MKAASSPPAAPPGSGRSGWPGRWLHSGRICSFKLPRCENLLLHVEICEDLWVPTPPSSFAALAGATVIANLSASNVVVGKEGYRHQLVGNQSARCIAAYLYSASGQGESTTDLAWDGHALIYENGSLVSESRRFADAPQLAFADVDLDRLLADRMRQNTFGARDAPARGRGVPDRRVRFAGAEGQIGFAEKNRAASLRSRATRARATRAARRCTASRCRGWPRACAPPAPRSW